MSTDRQSQAYDYLYNAIITNTLRPGYPIVEKEISNILGTSRTPVREALKQLESEGLVKRFAGKGTFVAEVNLQDIEEIFFLREILELGALQIAWNRINISDIERVEQLLLKLNTESSFEEFYESDRALHFLIVRYSGNRRIQTILNNTNTHIERLRQIASFNPNRTEKSKTEHLSIIHSLKERDYDTTRDLLIKHIHNVKQNTLEVYRAHLMSEPREIMHR